MGKRKLSFDVRKNHERNKYLKLNVSIPLELMKPFTVSLPLSNYTDATVTNGQTLSMRLCRWNQLPTHWSEAPLDVTHVSTVVDTPCIILYTVKCTWPPFAAEVTFSVLIHDDLTWMLLLGSLHVPLQQKPAAPTRLLSIPEVVSLLQTPGLLQIVCWKS